MKITKLADLLRKKIIIKYYPNQNNRFCANFENCDISENGFLIGEYENGETPEEALINYCKRISNKTIVFNGNSKSEQRYECPVLTI